MKKELKQLISTKGKHSSGNIMDGLMFKFDVLLEDSVDEILLGEKYTGNAHGILRRYIVDKLYEVGVMFSRDHDPIKNEKRYKPMPQNLKQLVDTKGKDTVKNMMHNLMFTFDAMLEDFTDQILLNESYLPNAHRNVKSELRGQLWDAGFRLSRDYDAVLDQ